MCLICLVGYWLHCRVIPKDIRKKWLNLMRHKKVAACFAGHYHRNVVAWPFKGQKTPEKKEEDKEDESESESDSEAEKPEKVSPINVRDCLHVDV